MEKEPQTHEMSQENALFTQNQSFKSSLRNANELSLLGFNALIVVDILVYIYIELFFPSLGRQCSI